MDEPAVAELLIDSGCDVHAFDDGGRTPLHVAVEVYCEGGARLLLARGASWDFVAPDVEDARSAREAAEDYGMDPSSWPDASGEEGSDAELG
jgi:ankyrin repeat protein